jgi:opacity protein-like surface antigen
MLIGLLANMPAGAGIAKGNSEVGFAFGFTQFDDNVTDDTGGRFDIRGGYLFSDLFQLEGQISASVAPEVEGTPIDLTISTFFVNAVFNFHPGPQIVPYALVGLGSANLELSNGGSFDDDSSAWQIAGGSRFFFGKSKRPSVRVEISYLSEDTFDEGSNHISATIGFSWRLGKEPQ